MAVLNSAQLSKHLLLLKLVAQHHPAACRVALEVLNAAQDRNRAVVARLLSEPWVGAWASRTLRNSGVEGLGYLGCVAAVAASRTGLSARLHGEVRRGVVMLPTVGA